MQHSAEAALVVGSVAPMNGRARGEGGEATVIRPIERGARGLACALMCALSSWVGCSAEQVAKTAGSDAGHDAAGLDAKTDAHGDALSDGDALVDGDDATTPIADTGEPDYGAPPPPGTHVEATIGPAGGVLAGLDGTPLAHVSLLVPAGALATPTLLAIDLDAVPVLPLGVTALSAFVRVGPDGAPFSLPARLSLPCPTYASAKSIGGLARVANAWSGLLEPAFEPSTKVLTVSMSRGAGAVGATLPDASMPKITAFSPAIAAPGDVIFLDGTGFGLAPAWLDDGDAGGPRASQILIGSVEATPLGWSDGALSLRVPAGATTGAITVRTPLAQATSATALSLP
jgi:hypothetical protein